MKEFMKQVSEWWKKMVADAKARAAERKEARLWKEAERTLQAREYDHDVWICYHDVPLFRENEVVDDLPTMLTIARKTWVDFHQREEGVHQVAIS